MIRSGNVHSVNSTAMPDMPLDLEQGNQHFYVLLQPCGSVSKLLHLLYLEKITGHRSDGVESGISNGLGPVARLRGVCRHIMKSTLPLKLGQSRAKDRLAIESYNVAAASCYFLH